MAHRTKRSMEKADFRVSDVETGERACRSGDVRDSGLGRQVATLAHLDFEGQVRVDTRSVCQKDVKKMLLGQATSTFWRKWAKHEHEELKEGIWLEPALTLLRRKRKEEWTDKHRHVAKKLVLEKRLGAEKTF